MAERDPNQHDSQDETGGTSDAPGLFERYQAQQQAWLAQADALARLRDEVRSAAEREAMEIVSTARRDIRQIIAEARRELLVLTAQLHATLGAATDAPPPPAALPAAQGDQEHQHIAGDVGAPDEVASDAGLVAFARARAGIEALADEASEFDVPLRKTASAPEPPAPAAAPQTSRLLDVRDGSVRGVPWRPHADLVPSATATPPSTGDNQRLKVAAGVGALVILVLAGLYWLSPSSGTEAPAASSETVSGAPAGSSQPAGAEEPVAADAESGEASSPGDPASSRPGSGLSIALTVQRPAWIRAIVDGSTRTERTYQAGETIRIDDGRSVSIRIGDPGAVLISVNGSRPEPFGADGQPLTRRFGEERAAAAPPPAAPASAAQTSSATAPTAPAAAPTPTRPAPSPPTPTPTTIAAAPQPQPDPASTAAEVAALESSSLWVPETNVVTAGQRWIDAYQRQDEKLMAAITPGTPNVVDERRPDQRFPTDAEGIKRQMETIGIEFTADSAVFTARMIEERTDGFNSQQHVSRVAQIWALRAGRWHLTDVRITNEAPGVRR